MTKINYFIKILNTFPVNKCVIRQCSLIKVESVSTDNNQLKINVDELNLKNEINQQKKLERGNILKPLNEDISYIGPFVQPTFNFAAYVNKSECLQKLVDLGVNLHQLEKRKDVPELILKLDFEKDIKPYIFFLHRLGVNTEDLGPFITKNPFIFQEDLENLEVRINYLQSKQFNKLMITRIVTKNPYWLNFSTARIDTRLGHFQKTFNLTGNEIRQLTTKQPQLITYNMEHIKLSTFSIKEEMNFSDEQLKELLLKVPKFWMMNQNTILSRFEYLHKTMNISNEQILQMPKVLTSRRFRIQNRHMFLEKLGRAQYNPKNENYVSLEALISGTDTEFCSNIAKSSIQAYNTFLKSF